MTKKQSFTCLWVGQSLANCGDVFYIVGMMTIIYAATQSAFYMAAVPFLTMMMRFISGIFAPLILDKFGLKCSLTRSQTAKSLLLLLLAIAFSFHLFGPDFLLIFLLAAGISFLDGWALPARNAMVPLLITKEKLVQTNSFLSLLDQSINLSGWALGGTLVTLFGGTKIVWGTFFLFLLSTVFMLLIEADTVSSQKMRDRAGRLEVMKEGWRAIGQTPLLRLISWTDAIGTIASVVWMAAIVFVFVHHVLHVSDAWWGFINFSYFVGLILGGLVSVRCATLIQHHLRQAALIGLLAIGIATLLFGWNKLPAIALVLSFAVGVFEQLQTIAFSTLIQTCTKPQLLAKVYAAQGALYAVAYGLATLVFGYLTDKIGVISVFTLSGLLILATFVYALRTKKEWPMQADC